MALMHGFEMIASMGREAAKEHSGNVAVLLELNEMDIKAYEECMMEITVAAGKHYCSQLAPLAVTKTEQDESGTTVEWIQSCFLELGPVVEVCFSECYEKWACAAGDTSSYACFAARSNLVVEYFRRRLFELVDHLLEMVPETGGMGSVARRATACSTHADPVNISMGGVAGAGIPGSQQLPSPQPSTVTRNVICGAEQNLLPLQSACTGQYLQLALEDEKHVDGRWGNFLQQVAEDLNERQSTFVALTLQLQTSNRIVSLARKHMELLVVEWMAQLEDERSLFPTRESMERLHNLLEEIGPGRLSQRDAVLVLSGIQERAIGLHLLNMRMKDTELACILSESDSFSAVADRLNSARTEEVKSLSGLLEEAAHDTYKVGASCICRIPVPPAAATPSAFTSNRSSTALQRWRDWDICTYNHLAEAMALLEPESAVCTVEQLLRYPFTAPVVQRLNPVCLPRPSQDIRMALRCPKNPLDAILAAASVLSHGFLRHIWRIRAGCGCEGENRVRRRGCGGVAGLGLLHVGEPMGAVCANTADALWV
eukprot:gene6-biopygen26